MRVKVVVHVPVDSANEVRAAIGAVGGGEIGNYSYSSFTVSGTGRFMPNEQASPHVGTAGALEMVDEERIEVTCERDNVKAIIDRIRASHPYEEATIDIYKLIDEDSL